MKKLDLLNGLLLRRRQSVAITPMSVENPVKEKHIFALMADISQFGYTLSDEVLSVLKTFPKSDLKYFHETLIKNLIDMTGGKIGYKPLFLNFPEDVPDQYEYLFVRILGYMDSLFQHGTDVVEYKVLSCGHVIDPALLNIDDFGACPICQFQPNEDVGVVKVRPKLKEITPLRVIDLVSTSEIYRVFTNLLQSPVSLGSQDYEDLTIILEKGKKNQIRESIPVITVKETLAKFAVLLLKHFKEADAIELLEGRNLTATDILRFYVALCDGDVSLSTQTKFNSVSNSQRRFILSLLNSVTAPEFDMVRYPESWKRVGEKLHPGTFSKKYPNAYNAFTLIRNNPESIETFASMYEQALDFKNPIKAGKILATRPGEFIRRLDNLIRLCKTKEEKDFILELFSKIVKDVKSLTLLQVRAHFSTRNKNKETRYFMPKGSMAKIKILPTDKKYSLIDSVTIDLIRAIIKLELKSRYALKSPLNRVFIDPALKTCLLPDVQRNATKALHTVSRGSILSMGDKDSRTIRMFIYWKGMVDLDLSVNGFDEDWKNVATVNYHNIDERDKGMIHSGDIRSAPKGATEFIDIDIDKAKASGIRYLVMSVISFSGENFKDFESFAGIMNRKEPGSGELYEPKTVSHRFEFEGEGLIAIPLIFDLYNEEFVYTDLVLKGVRGSNASSLGSDFLVLAKTIYDFVNTKPNLYDLFRMHAEVRCDTTMIDEVFNPDVEYDAVFGIDKGITPFDIDIINGEWID
jgi:hypothetical protein